MATKPASKPTSTYKVLSPVKFDGDTYAENDEIDLTDAQAKELIACGAVAAPPSEAKK